MTESGLVAIVTGAGRGIGRATALRLGEAGASVVLNARTARDLDAVQAGVASAGGRAVCVAGDAADANVVTQLVETAQTHFGRIHAIVTCAGLAPLAPVASLAPDDFDALVALNVRGVYLLTRAVWPEFVRHGGGTIVHVSSLASVDPFPGFSAYGGTKAFVNTFVKGLAVEGKDAHIRAYAVAPGAVDTDMLRALFPDFPHAQRLAPDEVAETIVSLITGDNAAPSGETLFLSRDGA